MRSRDRIRTLRGTLSFPARSGGDPVNTGKRNLILDDGRINIGYRVIDFRIWNGKMTGGNDAYACQAHLAMGLDITAAYPRADDNREIAWAAYNTSSGNIISDFRLVDPDHIIVRDLNIVLPYVDNSLADSTVNYYIMMEEYDITDQEAIISIIKEESQDVVN